MASGGVQHSGPRWVAHHQVERLEQGQVRAGQQAGHDLLLHERAIEEEPDQRVQRLFHGAG